MKIFLALTLFIFSQAYAATCTATSRTNYSTGQVLTSSALNADFNQLVTKANALDGGCVSDSSLEYTAFDSSLDALKNGIHQGCALSYSDANTVSVNKCILSVNGKFVKTTTATTVTWGGASSAEVVSTQYYVYALTTSSGSTLNLLISTVAPGADGLDVSGNKVVGQFYNNSSSAIERYSIYSWIGNGASRESGKSSTPGSTVPTDSFSFSYGDTNSTTVCATATCTYLDQIGSAVTSVTRALAGTYTINFAKIFTKVKCVGSAVVGLVTEPIYPMNSATGNVSLLTTGDSYGTIHCEGY